MSDLGGFSLHELFRAEAEQHTAALSEGLVRLEATSDAAAIEPLMRAAHSIKGAARVIGLDIAVGLAHAMEDVLVALQKGREVVTPARIDQLLQGTDLLASLAVVDENAVEGWSAVHRASVDSVMSALRAPVTTTERVAASLETTPATPANAASTPITPSTSDTAPKSNAATLATPKTTEPSPIDRQEAASAAPTGRSSSVRVSAEKLDRLLQLAGETMLESRRLGALREEALLLKRDLVRLEDEIDRVREELRKSGVDADLFSSARALLSKGQSRTLGHLRTIENAIRRGEETSAQLYHEVLSSRMRPFADATGALARMVRDLARTLGKEVRLEVLGEQVPVDRDILSRLDAPLNHMLRNALDHGVESPDERRMRGKSAQATLRVEARHHAGQLRVRVSDDGRGIDLEQLRERIVRRGLATAEMAADLNRQELLEFLFLPGFSTAKQVTEISGRGVGLDVVQTTAREFGGTARIETTLGMGTTFELQLPITLSVIRALLVDVSGEILAFPLARIDRVVEPDRSAMTNVAGRRQFLLETMSESTVESAGDADGISGEIARTAFGGAATRRNIDSTVDMGGTEDSSVTFDSSAGKIANRDGLPGRDAAISSQVSIGVVEASQVLALATPQHRSEPTSDPRAHIVILGDGTERYGFEVDALVGEEDLVVRPLDARFGNVAHIAAAAVRESGEPVLIVDTEDVLQSVRVALHEGKLRGASRLPHESDDRALHALVVDDSATVREVERQILTRLGFVVETAVDGLDGLHALRAGRFDLVVSDIDMPRMNGLEFVRALRTEQRFATTPVIVVSYKDRDEDRLAGLEAGATAYLTKGAFRDSTFVDTVRDLLGDLLRDKIRDKASDKVDPRAASSDTARGAS
jgi:two-component system sensor histidine kinase and response regulator WspE